MINTDADSKGENACLNLLKKSPQLRFLGAVKPGYVTPYITINTTVAGTSCQVATKGEEVSEINQSLYFYVAAYLSFADFFHPCLARWSPRILGL
jgi:hypothetical protein